MRVYVPATPDGLHHRTVPAILESGYVATVVPMLEVESYFLAMAAWWAAGETFAIVEHDIEVDPYPGRVNATVLPTLRQLDECPEPWCAFSYEVFAGDVATAYGGPFALGCTRFRAELLAAVPDAVELAGNLNEHPVHKARSYAVMDSTLTRVLRGYVAAGTIPPVCHHLPNVTHHHHYMRAGAFPPWHPPGE